MSSYEEAQAIQRMAREAEASQAASPEKTEKKKATTADVVKKAADSLGASDLNASAMYASDPRVAAALLGAAHGAWKSGASFNPLNPTFLQSNPRYNGFTPAPRPTYNPQGSTPVLHTQTGNASAAGTTAGENMLTNQTLNKSFASAPAGQIENLAEHGITGDSMNQLYAKTGPTEVRLIGGKPMELPIGAVDRLPTQAPQTANNTQKIVGALERYAPNVTKVGQWAKGVLPTLTTIGKGAGVAGAAGDILKRLYEGDTTGAGISGAGALAGALLAPEIAIPVAAGSMGINYLRDHPELIHKQMTNEDQKSLERMMSVGP